MGKQKSLNKPGTSDKLKSFVEWNIKSLQARVLIVSEWNVSHNEIERDKVIILCLVISWRIDGSTYKKAAFVSRQKTDSSYNVSIM